MKVLLKSTILIILSAAIIYLMSTHNFLQFDSLRLAFIHNKKLIYLVVFLQILSCFITTLRYFSLLKIFNIHVDFKNVTAATFVSNGLGLWMPGSMAFIEIIRVGLMLGVGHKSQLDSKATELKVDNSISENKEQLSLRARLTTVSLFDRLIGLWSMLFVGLMMIIVTLFTLHKKISNNFESVGLIILFAFTVLLITFITLLPYVASKVFFRRIIEHIQRFFLILFKYGFINKILKKIFLEIDSILDAVSIGGKKFEGYLIPALYSFLCVFIQAIGTYYCAIAISSFIPFPAILATVPILAIATLLPIGFGGIGGAQFIAAISMSIFGVMPHSAASAQLLQTALNLLSLSFVGLFFSKLTSKQIKYVLKMYELKKIQEKI